MKTYRELVEELEEGFLDKVKSVLSYPDKPHTKHKSISKEEMKKSIEKNQKWLKSKPVKTSHDSDQSYLHQHNFTN